MVRPSCRSSLQYKHDSHSTLEHRAHSLSTPVLPVLDVTRELFIANWQPADRFPKTQAEHLATPPFLRAYQRIAFSKSQLNYAPKIMEPIGRPYTLDALPFLQAFLRNDQQDPACYVIAHTSAELSGYIRERIFDVAGEPLGMDRETCDRSYDL